MAEPARTLRYKLRSLVRRYPWVYAGWRVVKYGPFMGLRWNAPRRLLLERSQREQWRNLYLGSGGRRQDRMINLDITPVTGPDVVGDGYCLPFADGTFDAIFCEYVIEHVDDPEAFIKAASSALKTGGSWYFEAPFLQPIHADGVDFTRWTKRGFAAALARCDLEVVQSGIHTGPAYALFWTIKDTAALTLSGGYQPIYLVTRYILAWLLWPLMLADFLLLRLPAAEQLASGYYFIAVKKSAS